MGLWRGHFVDSFVQLHCDPYINHGLKCTNQEVRWDPPTFITFDQLKNGAFLRGSVHFVSPPFTPLNSWSTEVTRPHLLIGSQISCWFPYSFKYNKWPLNFKSFKKYIYYKRPAILLGLVRCIYYILIAVGLTVHLASLDWSCFSGLCGPADLHPCYKRPCPVYWILPSN